MGRLMTTKEQVLGLLEANGNNYLSGQEIADKIYVSRAAVWKAIKSLEKEGYEIDAVTNKGYRLKCDVKLMNAKTITECLKCNSGTEETSENNWKYGQIFYEDTVESTNDWAKNYSNAHFGEPAVFVADSQTKGKGRRGRDFFSPSGTGLYMSMLLYPDITPEKATLFTCMMAECLCEAIREVTEKEVKIKWVNDIYLGDKKIAGILTEGMTSMEDGKLSYMVIGVGVNIYNPYDGFPEGLDKTAGYLLEKMSDEDIRSQLCAAIISRFMEYYNKPEDKSFINGYRNKSMLIGKYVKLLTADHEEKKASKGYAKVIGIDDMCHLLIEYDDGTEGALSCGEVSVVKY